MIILTDDFALKADTRCLTICKKRKKKGKYLWEPEFYFTNLEQVFQKLVSLAIVTGIEKGSWEDVKIEVEKTRQMINEKMELLTSI